MFHLATPEEIRAGVITDVYFARSIEVLRAKGIDAHVRAEFIAKSLPAGWSWAVLAGQEECREVFSGLPVKVRMMREGTVFRPYEPVMEVEGSYTAFGLYETALLGLLCQASGVATMAARCKKAAGERDLISFGARRMHPGIAPMIERNAYIGGCDGVAVGRSAELIDREAVGTMPHALILLFGDTVAATRAYDEVIDPKVRRVSLIDTFQDEKFEAIRVAEAMGGRLYAMRLDTPGTRRGDFYRIIEEVRWELDLRGYKDIKLYVSGGLDEYEIFELNPVCDGYGVGTAISNAPVVDFAMDIMEINGEPIAKRGKHSGAKRVVECEKCEGREIIPLKDERERCECGGRLRDLLVPFADRGKFAWAQPAASEIRDFVLEQVKELVVE
jgi:nicotinate phosphoribosyltransferase